MLLIGVPIFHSLSSASAVTSRVAGLLKVYRGIKDPSITPALQLRAFLAFALSSLDYLMQGVLLRSLDLRAAQVIVNKAHRAPLEPPSGLIYPSSNYPSPKGEPAPPTSARGPPSSWPGPT